MSASPTALIKAMKLMCMTSIASAASTVNAQWATAITKPISATHNAALIKQSGNI